METGWPALKKDFETCTRTRALTVMGMGALFPTYIWMVAQPALKITDPLMAGYLMGALSFPMAYAGIKMAALKGSDADRWRHNVLKRSFIALSVASTVGFAHHNLVHEKQEFARTRNDLPYIAPDHRETMPPPRTMAEKYCTARKTGAVVHAEDDGKKYRLICP